jgi:hypothetical protein
LAGREASRHPVEARAASPVIKTENAKNATGTDISGAGDPSIQGFASDISVSTGQTVNFKIKTDSTTADPGLSSRLLRRPRRAQGCDPRPVHDLPEQTVPCATDAATGLVMRA